jgi:hypothetical protein
MPSTRTGRAVASSTPDPEPPDDQGAESSHLVAVPDETPVTAGGLVIREPSPCLSPPGPLVSPQAGVVAVRPAIDNGEGAMQQPPSLPAVAAIAQPSSKEPQVTQKRAQVMLEEVTDEEAGLPRRAPTSSHCMNYDPMEGASPESEQQDSVLGNPVAQSTARDAFHGDTQFHSVKSVRPSVSASRFSRNTESIQQVMCEHAE